MARKMFATAPDGFVVSTTTDNPYTHFLIAPDRDGSGWHRVSAHSRLDLATKALTGHRANGHAGVILVPATDTKPEVTVDAKQDNTNGGVMKANAKSQGFPAAYLGSKGNFRPGMDARAKSDLRAAVAGKRTGKELHRFTAKSAGRLLAVRGW